MTKGKRVDEGIKAEILNKIRDEGMKVSLASQQYGISSKRIYTWLRDGVFNGSANLILENNRLKKELEQAYNLLGRATAELRRPKK
jgi:transposase-like protein